jgi:hypothetical protein
MTNPGTKRFAWLLLLGALPCARLLQASVPDRPSLARLGTEAMSDVRILARVEPAGLTWAGPPTRTATSAVRVRLRADGTVSEILCVQSIGSEVDLNDWNLKVADAVKQWRFEAAARDVTVSVRLLPRAP